MKSEKTTGEMKDVPLTKSLERLHELIDGISIAMFTTRRVDGRLVSRPMDTQERSGVADLWFVADTDSQKIDELEQYPDVNVAYYRDRTREFVSVAGVASVTRDPEIIRELWKPDWRAWFGKETTRENAADNPRIAIILVEAQSATWFEKTKSTPVALFEVVKGIITGSTPDIGEIRTAEGEELGNPAT